jgi:hypothetical protein
MLPEFLDKNFWEFHGILFLVFISFFPRLTLFFSSVPFGGLFWWLGFIFAPRILVAVLATINYGKQNPVLVVISWIVALSGESTEKYYVRNRVVVRTHKRPASGAKNDAIDVEYERLDD